MIGVFSRPQFYLHSSLTSSHPCSPSRLHRFPYQLVKNLFIKVETTPNPQSMKFLPDVPVLPESYGTGIYIQKTDRNEVKRSPLARKLFSVDGVKGIFIGNSFITVTKSDVENWTYFKHKIFSEIFDFFAANLPVISEQTEADPVDSIGYSDTAILDTDSEIVATIKELLESRIRPSVQEDGGDIFYVGFDELTGIVQVRLAGSCVGCPSSSVTLRNGVENMLKHYIPEVKGIEEVPNVDVNEEDNKLSFNPQEASN